MDEDRLQTLLESYLEGRLTTDEQAQLEAELVRSPEARAIYWSCLGQHAMLRQIVLKAKGRALAARRRLLPRWILGSAAAALVLGVGLYFLWPGDALARLEEVKGRVEIVSEEERTSASSGTPILAGQGLETLSADSGATLLYPDGTRVKLSPRTLLRRISDNGTGKQVALAKGAIAATIARQPEGRSMVFTTPQGEARVVGTTLRLVVENGQKGLTRLEVNEGKVKLTRSDGNAVDVVTGQYAVAAAGVDLVAKPIAPEPGRSALRTQVARMKPGTWAELDTIGFEKGAFLMPVGASGPVTYIADSACWDPLSRQFLFLGFTGRFVFIAYNEETNSWRTIAPHPDMAAITVASAGDQNTMDPRRGEFYHRPYNSDKLYRHRVQDGTWSVLPAVPPSVLYLKDRAVLAGLAYFPELDGAVLVGGEQSPQGGAVAFFSAATGQWTRLAEDLPMGVHNTFAEYNPVRKTVIFGGGDTRDLYRLDSSGKITTMKKAPVSLGVSQSIVTVDPRGGHYLVFHKSRRFFAYDDASDAWIELRDGPAPIFVPGSEDGIHSTVAAPIPAHGVVMVVNYRGVGDSKVYLYKHSD